MGAASLARCGASRAQDAPRAFGPQRLQTPAPAFVAAAPCGDAAQIPIALGGDALVEAGRLAFFVLDQLLRPIVELLEAVIELVQPAAIQPQHSGSQPAQEGAVMADEHQRAGESQQQLFQPLDGGQIEMVGRLVQQQQVGVAGQRSRQGCAPALAARKLGRVARTIEAETIEQGCHPVGRRAIGRHEIGERAKAGEVRLLRQHADGKPRLDEARAAIEIHLAREQAQDRRFAAAIGAHQGHALAARDRETDIAEQRAAAEGEPRLAQQGDGGRGGHASQVILRSLLTRS